MELGTVKKEVFREALLSAWLQVAPRAVAKKLAALVLGAQAAAWCLLMPVMERLEAAPYL